MEALSHSLLLCAGGDLDSADVVDSLLLAGLDRGVAEAAEKAFAEHRTFLRAAVDASAAEVAPAAAIPHYKDLEWRVQVMRRRCYCRHLNCRSLLLYSTLLFVIVVVILVVLVIVVLAVTPAAKG